ncbi:MAG: 1-(5-phosphoribosyl)-5-[(5-phosphoribosylamino)methylideneamino]imidazole-4-carboxamide isomerase [Nitrospinae bacterium]|nr:1-(5-phosphoribosyl)-5-[(5-phosphoribosylamino)methylideneamino]imidazole-4-carboxamide isomerase [Nitrospinota bacterium]
MNIIPAIDIKGGRCVRLSQGDMAKETVYSTDPVDQALKWEQAGAKIIHIVDLDGAVEGKPKNAALVRKICRSVECRIQLGGGIRSLEIAEQHFECGVSNIVLGTMLINNWKLALEIINKHPGRVLAGIDTKNGIILGSGWTEVSDLKATVFTATNLAPLTALAGIVFTDVSRDGMLQGTNLKEIENMASLSGGRLIASGGVSTMADLDKLSRIPGVSGAIIGKAIYTGAIDLKGAVGRFQFKAK